MGSSGILSFSSFFNRAVQIPNIKNVQQQEINNINSCYNIFYNKIEEFQEKICNKFNKLNFQSRTDIKMSLARPLYQHSLCIYSNWLVHSCPITLLNQNQIPKASDPPPLLTTLQKFWPLSDSSGYHGYIYIYNYGYWSIRLSWLFYSYNYGYWPILLPWLYL